MTVPTDPTAPGPVAVWMDQGGTFTDVVRVWRGGAVQVDKVLSDRADLTALGAGCADVRRGTTVATNALLEGRGARVLLVTTEGLGDLPWLGDQTRPRLFDLHAQRRPPPCAAVLEATGRIRADGVVQAPARLDGDALRAVRGRGIDAVAVVLAHGPLAPAEERRLGERCREAGFSHVSLGHEVAPSRGLLARLVTTLCDAALSPLLPRAPGHYLRSDGGLAREGLPGAAPQEWRGAVSVLSGPAGGVVAVARLAQELDLGPCFGLDMGGTSADVCRVDGAPRRRASLRIEGLTLRTPTLDLHTVAAGGGSRLAVRAGLYAVGPQSAGADPGPASYGRGGPAAVTDCEALLGRLPAFPRVCGPGRDQPLDLDAAREAVAALDAARRVEDVATDFVHVAQEAMARAVRAFAARDGVSPRDHALVAFGGAGPGHACGVARRLGVRRVVVPKLAGGWSAVGIGHAARRAEVVAPVVGGVAAALAEARAQLPFAGEARCALVGRHVGTETDLPVALPDGPLPPETALLRAFHEAHRRRFGFARATHAVEWVEVRASVEERLAHPALTPPPVPDPPRETATAWFEGWREVPWRSVHRAHGLIGPALLSGGTTTVVVPPGWRVEDLGPALILRDEGQQAPPRRPASSPAALALFASRVGAVAEQMGERLQRLARSVNIRERRDFSCAVFDADGQLVVNAPHVPVHLGAMGETVRGLLRRQASRLAPGQCWVSNSPYEGGSHLPDITVMQPVFVAGRRAGFVACRGHHVDVGGVQPGSMPPHSTRIEQEGIVLDEQLLVEGGAAQPIALEGCREPATVRADLEAQAAACQLGAEALTQLAASLPPDAVQEGFGALLDAAEEAVRSALASRPGAVSVREEMDDGHMVDVTLTVSGGEARVTLDAAAHPGNRNAPPAVARAAVLYALRCLLAEELPLNEGALRPLTLVATPGGLFDPQPPAAVVGGNVETSQLLVDALLRALGLCAGSQGTMNNLTLGTPTGAWYETLAGGGGAGPGGPGLDASQVHMTNTRATDVEELEHRFGVVVEEWRRRDGSGGGGEHAGGVGIRKRWRFLVAAEVGLLASRRRAGPLGLEGGRPGEPGRDWRDTGAGWEPAPPRWSAKPGDRLLIETPGGGGWGTPPDGRRSAE